ncbi:hypothetical protein LUZ61_009693 [Rhynchospora tenuis]|uniref:X8 domain-containing protein n=1 Tax=Rhynchospora tenuis TaxID=198213 RepID=A0AAD6EYX6_9POAL|nr:hypothetical protein LUZ61_009693 [Rhynchospora tenuis]
MALLIYAVLILTLFGRSDAGFCTCRSDLPDTVLQKTLDYACGHGADCNPILQNGACYNPNTVKGHCSYAVNSYYQRNGQSPDACQFPYNGAATTIVSTTDPSYTGCAYPATQSAAGTSTTTTTSSTPGTTSSIYSPPGTVMGGLGPSGNSISTDSSDASLRLLPVHKIMPHAIAILCFFLMLL